ncbi:Uridine kinase [Peltigera leucophlebia]|nr:Uridine kinase [Peltigera leucophlebia]
MEITHYSPPWANTSIIGIAGGSGSGKTSLAVEIVTSLNLPWVVILSMDSFYKILTPEQHELAHKNEFDLDSPDSIDFDLLVKCLEDLKQGEVIRDVRERGRDVEGCVKQWVSFVKPNFQRYVEPQRNKADIIIPRGIENKVAIDMVVKHVQRLLQEKSRKHQDDLKRLGEQVEDEPLSPNVLVMEQTKQILGMNTIIQNPMTETVDFIFYFDRLSTLLVERAMENVHFKTKTVQTPQGYAYNGLEASGEVSAVVILRAGSCLENGLKRVIPDCRTGRVLIQSNYRTGEPELHYQRLPADISAHDGVLLLDPQMSNGGAELMAVKVLVDHGVSQEKIVFVTYFAEKMGVKRLLKVFPKVKVVVCTIIGDLQERWIEKRYFGC